VPSYRPRPGRPETLPRHATVHAAIRRCAALAVALAAAPLAAQDCPPGDLECQVDRQRYALCRVNRLLDFYQPGLPGPEGRESAQTSIDGGRFDVSDSQRILIEDEVEVRRADQLLRGDSLAYDTGTGAWTVASPMTFQDSGMLLSASAGEGNIDDGTARLEDVRYQLLASRGNGRAESIRILDPERSRLEGMTFSTCDIDDPDWQLRARRIDLDQETGVGKARSATLDFRGVPLLYVPYGEFPIDDRRKSGMLSPTLGRSNNGGIDFMLPYYINLAPNYDMTLYPRVIGDRGFMLGAEFRYLFEGDHRGEVFATYLPDDRDYGDSRGYFEFKHYSRLNSQWYFDADIRQVSDDRYFEDFGDSLSIAATSVLPSRAGVYGRGDWWNAAIAVDAYKITDPNLPGVFEPYRRLPRMTFDARERIGLGLVAGVDSELVRFSKNEGPEDGTRIDVYPYLALPIERSGWFLRPELGWRQTEYDYDLGAGSRDESRGLPIFSIDGGLVFERQSSLFGRDWLQTLEPRLFYLNVPYEDQSALPVFDTQELTFGFGQLFRNNRFVGADRQGDADQATFALTSRLIEDASGRERVTASFGQIRYFRPQRVQLPGRPESDFSGSAYVGELNVRLSDDWYASVGGQWNPETDRTDVSSLRLQRRFGERGVVNFAYRYRRDSAQQTTFLEQIDTSALYAINERWRLVGRWNWSLLDSATLEGLAGFEYESCCYAVRLMGRHYVRNTEGDRSNAVYLEVELKGLGSLGRQSEDLLRRAILGYSRYGQ
jgi:LPS-assembly protein